ncbi:RNA polymerase sigma-70 factor [Maribellus comscasis]|uniref:RNA polymerase sigma-70 factor n=1 Tax=Maribellus comscasis TaxID=2681766 RepID=A0A6I6K0Z7_9BACT|nr:RNA polymerase sigma-70 factor [Maribellus comscasis]QGY46227.1 RNA polymerase sigma-70 factor [Maribellus comscasis]
MPGIDRTKFIELFHQMYQPVKNYIYFKTGDAEMAEDIAQDTFTKVWEKKDDIREETIKSLLYTIAGNLCKNRFEHQQVVFDFAKRYKPEENLASPEFELEFKEFNDKLEKAIGALKEKNRIVFLMNRIDGFTYNEIADHLGLSVKAIEKRMKNALDELKKTIEYKI